jgi:hypothetical protein
VKLSGREGEHEKGIPAGRNRSAPRSSPFGMSQGRSLSVAIE